jgi:arsenical pump membrane protein
VLLALGAAAVAAGLLPRADAERTLRRVLPLLVFLASVTVLAELTARAEVFDVAASRLARLAAGSYLALFLLCAAFASATTAFLNLDTTAVLLTPVMLATARRARVDPLPLAMMTVWLANTASLLLPVSNLTNLLAADRVGLGPAAFAARMAVPELASVAVTMAALWLLYWRRGRRGADRYRPPSAHRPGDRFLFAVAALTCAVFVAGNVVGAALPLVALACAGVLVAAFAARDRGELRPSLFPWRLLVFVTGLFLVVQTVGLHGLDGAIRAMLGGEAGPLGVARAAVSSAVLSNLLNNLPSYVAGEAALPPAGHERLLGLLVGTNVGPIVTPWASLATLLWAERCRAAGVAIRWSRFALAGAAAAVGVLAVTTLALVLTG